uniref:Copine C-terminal domain-containing protein n=1 Tax=Ciona intestinalis TaxID=7719 RepID=H2Y1K8_CIOIN
KNLGNKFNGDPDYIHTRFQTFEDVSGAMVDAGIKKCQLILGIDFTASNEWQGRVSNRGQSLHNITQKFKANQNPYQHVITILQHTLKDMVDANVIHAFGFGDSVTKDISTFCLRADGMPCGSFDDVLHCYRECASKITLGGPTSYAPIVHKAIEIVEQTNQYNILVIIADGQFVDEGPTARAIVEASYYPLSIIVVGVGDGPWDTMHQFDDWLPERNFDNFQFVEYGKIISNTYDKSKNPETMLALHMLMEIPDQYK